MAAPPRWLLLGLQPLLVACGVAAEPAGHGFLDDCVPRPASLARRTGRRPGSQTAAAVLFLELEGAKIAKGLVSDAPTNQSYVCGADFPAWDASRFGSDRSESVQRLRSRVEELFVDFNLRVVTERPPQPPYVMVVVGGTASLCGRPDGLGGLGPLDCGNADLSDVAFVFGATLIDLDGLAVAIAHEAGHTWGLPHTTEPCDVMSSSWCSGGAKRFRDQEMTVPAGDPAGTCGLTTSNSWQRLRGVLGPRPTRPAEAGSIEARSRVDGGGSGLEPPLPSGPGCSTAFPRGSLGAGGPAYGSSPRAASLLLLLTLGLLLGLCRRAARPRAETENGHSRRDQLGNR